ncbi:hypothetical protein BOX15_Mlig011821g5, partial [Macrostomum lignano]
FTAAAARPAARIAIVGAGIAGLSAASTLARLAAAANRQPLEIWLLDKSDRPGGWVRTATDSAGCVYELGPRTIRGASPSGSYLLDLVRQSGLKDELVTLTTSHPAAARRLVAIDNQLTTVGQLLAKNLVSSKPPFQRSLIGWTASQWLAGQWPPKPLAEGTDQSLDEFARSRLGPDLTDYLLDPLTRGVFAGRLSDLGVAAAFPHLPEAERRRGSLLLGLLAPSASKSPPDPLLGDRCAVWSLKRGLGSLAEACLDKLRQDANVRCRFGSAVESLRRLADGRIGLRLSTTKDVSGEASFDGVILCVPAFSAARLWPERLGRLTPELSSLPWVSLAIVSLLYNGNPVPEPAFGHLVPSGASGGEPAVLGVVYDSCLFPDRQPAGSARLTCMLGGAWYHRIAGLSSDSLIRLAVNHVTACLGPSASRPVAADCRLLTNCIPQYPVGHVGQVADWRDGLAGAGAPILLAGASYDGVSVPDCARSGAQQAKECLRLLRLLPH